MSRLRTQMQDATSCLGASTVLAHGTPSADFRSKNDLHAFPSLAEAATLLPLRAGGLALVPIDGKMREIEALACFGLPTAIRHGRTDQLDPPLSGVNQQFHVHIPCIYHLLLRLESCFYQLRLNDGSHVRVWGRSHGGLHLNNQVGTHRFLWQATSFRQMDLVSQPDR